MRRKLFRIMGSRKGYMDRAKKNKDAGRIGRLSTYEVCDTAENDLVRVSDSKFFLMEQISKVSFPSPGKLRKSAIS
jgi:hypothetical protein